jgi:hypothetical protein
MNTWVLTVEEEPETTDLFLTLPEDLLKEVGWKTGDILEWVEQDDKSWILRKKADVDVP